MLVAEYDGNGNLVAKYHNDGAGLMAMTSGNQSYWYGFEGIGTVRQLMNAQGQVIDRYVFDAWGNELTNPQSQVTNPFRYVGKSNYYTDSPSGLLLLGLRYYEPSVGRFINLDPLRLGNNWFVYANNTPTRYIDPTGAAPWLPIVCGIACGAALVPILGCISGGLRNPADILCCAIEAIAESYDLGKGVVIGGAIACLACIGGNLISRGFGPQIAQCLIGAVSAALMTGLTSQNCGEKMCSAIAGCMAGLTWDNPVVGGPGGSAGVGFIVYCSCLYSSVYFQAGGQKGSLWWLCDCFVNRLRESPIPPIILP